MQDKKESILRGLVFLLHSKFMRKKLYSADKFAEVEGLKPEFVYDVLNGKAELTLELARMFGDFIDDRLFTISLNSIGDEAEDDIDVCGDVGDFQRGFDGGFFKDAIYRL